MPSVLDHPSLLHCLRHWEQARPEAIYMTQPYPDGRVVDYRWREVAEQSRRMAAHLKSLGLPPGSCIAILGRNSAHWLMADFAIWMAGHVTVPLYPTMNAATARYVLEHSEARLLFLGKMDGVADAWNDVRNGLPDSLPMIALPMAPRADLPRWDDVIARHEPLPDYATRQPDELATIVYTSGTTGKPKGVMHSFASMMAFPRSSARQIERGELVPFGPADRAISYLPLAHVAERAGVEAASLYFGLRVFFANSLETFQQDLKRARPTLFGSVPRLWTKFYLAINEKLPPRRQKILFNLPLLGRALKRKILSELGLDRVRMALSGAAPLPPDIIQWYRDLGLDLLEIYGMSENFAVSHITRANAVRVGYVGAPAPGCECRIDENGEVLVKSPGQMLGYYKQPALTAESMTPDGFFRTGDMGEIDGEGRLKITGRVKELFKTSKGKYVAPVPIENRLGSHPKIEAVCITGPGEPQPFALVMLSADAQQSLRDDARRQALGAEFAALLAQVNAALEDHEKIQFLVVVKEPWTMENGLLTPTMKIKRNLLEQRYLARAGEWAGAREPVIWER